MKRTKAFTIPYVIWMALFVVAPIVLVVVYAFSNDLGGFTLENFSKMGTYAVVFGRSFKLALIATLICLVIGYPVSYMMSREGERFQRAAMVLIMLPMWINFLLRTYSWMSILENNGLLNQVFQKTGLLSLYNSLFGTSLEYFPMMNTQGAVVLGMLAINIPLGRIVFALPPRAFFYTFLVAVASSFFAVILLQAGVRYLSATTAAVFSLLEPVSCALAGAAWLGEGFTLQKLAGSAVILGAAGLLACAKPEVSPDSREDLELMMSAEGYPDPPEEEKREVPKE